jgi:hypothetical protein
MNSYGEAGSPSTPVIIIGLITEANVNQLSVLQKIGSLSLFTFNLTGRICVDARCPVDFTPNLAFRPNDTFEIEFNASKLEVKLSVPRTGFQFETQLAE